MKNIKKKYFLLAFSLAFAQSGLVSPMQLDEVSEGVVEQRQDGIALPARFLCEDPKVPGILYAAYAAYKDGQELNDEFADYEDQEEEVAVEEDNPFEGMDFDLDSDNYVAADVNPIEPEYESADYEDQEEEVAVVGDNLFEGMDFDGDNHDAADVEPIEPEHWVKSFFRRNIKRFTTGISNAASSLNPKRKIDTVVDDLKEQGRLLKERGSAFIEHCKNQIILFMLVCAVFKMTGIL